MKLKRTFIFALLGGAVLAVAGVSLAMARTPGTSLAEASKATAQYRLLGVARKDQYHLLRDKAGISCIAMPAMPGMGPVGAMGEHFVNDALVKNPSVDAAAPEALVYEPTATGKLRLVAVEYVVIKAAWDASHTATPSLFGHRFNVTPGGNRFGLPAFYSLHAWIWRSNPSGMFAMFNPTVECPA